MWAATAALVAIGAVLMVIGSVMPWVRASAPGGHRVTRLGIDAGAGWLTALAGVLLAIEAGRWLQLRRSTRFGGAVTLLVAGAGGLIAARGFGELSRAVGHIPGATGPVTRWGGVGVPMIVAGFVAVLSGAVAAALTSVPDQPPPMRTTRPVNRRLSSAGSP